MDLDAMIAKTLADASRQKPPTRKRLSATKEAVLGHASAINKMVERGWSAGAVARLLKAKGVPGSVDTIATYVRTAIESASRRRRGQDDSDN